MSTIKHLTQSLVDQVRAAFSGKRLEKLDASMAVIAESVAQGAWISRGSIKARAGFYQGISKARMPNNGRLGLEYGSEESLDYACAEGVSSMLNYGSPMRIILPDGECRFVAATDEQFERGLKYLRKAGDGLKITDEAARAWRALVGEVSDLCKLLDVTKPLPVKTAIGLSPRVTATLKEMNLDLDISTVKPAKIVTYYVDSFDKNNRPIQVACQRVEWTPGIVHHTSRFAHGNGPQCHACGKNIPSRMYTPVEAQDKKGNRLVALWLGCDCARHIFGIKYAGIAKGAAA